MDDEIWEQGVLETVDVDGNTSLSPESNFRAWTALTEADFSRNDLPYIDESVVIVFQDSVQLRNLRKTTTFQPVWY